MSLLELHQIPSHSNPSDGSRRGDPAVSMGDEDLQSATHVLAEKSRMSRLVAMFALSCLALVLTGLVVFLTKDAEKKLVVLLLLQLGFAITATTLGIHRWRSTQSSASGSSYSDSEGQDIEQELESREGRPLDSITSVTSSVLEQSDTSVAPDGLLNGVIASKKREVSLRMGWERAIFKRAMDRRRELLNQSPSYTASASSVHALAFVMNASSGSAVSQSSPYVAQIAGGQKGRRTPFSALQKMITKNAKKMRQVYNRQSSHRFCEFTSSHSLESFSGVLLDRRGQASTLHHVLQVLRDCPYANVLLLPSTLMRFPLDTERWWLVSARPAWGQNTLADLVTNPSLRRYLNVNVVVQLLQYLLIVLGKALHYNGVAHGSLTPENVLVDCTLTRLTLKNLQFSKLYSPSHFLVTSAEGEKLSIHGLSKDLEAFGSIARYLYELVSEEFVTAMPTGPVGRTLGVINDFSEVASAACTTGILIDELLMHPLVRDSSILVPMRFVSSSAVQLQFDASADLMSRDEGGTSGGRELTFLV